MLYLCWNFNHATGIAKATQHYSYNINGHIMKGNLTEHYDLHLPQRAVGKFNLRICK
jgi:hypothetical protein